MINSFDLSKYPLPAPPPRKETIIEKADNLIDIRTVMRKKDMWAPEGLFYSFKINCPWDYEHPDGGMDKNCRVFGSTNIYCWAMHGYITPTMLHSRWFSVTRKKAAEELLDEAGLLKKNYKDTWVDLVDLRAEREHAKLGPQNFAVTALHKALENNKLYQQQEFSGAVRLMWAEVLEDLDALWEVSTSNYSDLEVWLENSLTKILTSATLETTDNH